MIEPSDGQQEAVRQGKLLARQQENKDADSLAIVALLLLLFSVLVTIL